MSAETITTAIFLITTVVAAAVLVNAIFPVISGMSGTFSSTTHQADVQIRTDFKIIATLAMHNGGTTEDPGTAHIWMKNIGSEKIALEGIRDSATVLCGEPTDFTLLTYSANPGNGNWKYTITSDNEYWDPGESLEITCYTTKIPTSSNPVYFQFALANGVWRSTEFNVAG
ncbi:MAG: flagellin [Methanoregula sp.]|jgi:flagellar protein FlaG